jgi:hypothetical protein
VSKCLQPYVYWGIQFTSQTGEEHIATCPFCNHDDTKTGNGHFFVNEHTGAFCCKTGICGAEGSNREFLRLVYTTSLEETTERDLLRFVRDQGIPYPTLKGKLAHKDEKYFIPIYNPLGEIIDLRVYKKGKKEQSTAGIQTGLYNLPALIQSNYSSKIVYICGSFRDALALEWLLWRNGCNDIVVATPGENTFKDDWIQFFEKRMVSICFDHDDAGYGFLDEIGMRATGSRKIGLKLRHTVASINYLTWPEKTKKGFDVRDFVIRNKQQPGKAYKTLKSYIGPHHRDEQEQVITKKQKNTPLSSVLEEASGVIELNEELINAIKISLATAISVRLPGTDNVWMFLMGPPGAGKTLILKTFNKSLHVIWESRLTKTALVSGFGLGNPAMRGTDFSILAKIHNRCLVLKDYTEILSLPERERSDLFGILRGAYDGRVRVPFGNGFRDYVCSFSFLAGVTQEIKMFNTASLGERFIRYQISGGGIDIEAIQDKALDLQITGEEPTEKLTNLVTDFLNNTYDTEPQSIIGRVPRWFRDRIKPLSNLVASLRATVPRFDIGHKRGQIAYEPVAETGNRVAVQLEKLAISLAIIEDKPQIDEEIYTIIKKIAVDTVDSFTTNIIRKLVEHNQPVTKRDMIKVTGLRNLYPHLEDLEILGLVEQDVSHNGQLVNKYSIAKKIKDYWKRAAL